MDLFDPAIPLPPWFSEEDLSVYASLYEKSGFRFPLQIPYRSLAVDCGYTDPKVSAPTLLIMGEKDYILKISGFGDYIRTGAVKQFVPDLDIKYIAEGNHFMQEQLPEQINQLILTFLGKHGI
ncbi:putative soluble epoxide hydrolase [Rosa chinensis]|uniref:Putative soluble epoxide hydrolase n=2 Tax=Rosa chinensis TaxID=74649 RepID=A0A2P6QU91_ROSCH|nr:putative soluble epoxide hydrolase [Rosa chinensis]